MVVTMLVRKNLLDVLLLACGAAEVTAEAGMELAGEGDTAVGLV